MNPLASLGSVAAAVALAVTSCIQHAATVPMPAWATEATPLAGLPTWRTDDEAVHFLMTGELTGPRKVRPPMPEYRMSQTDAEDTVAYLRSLGPRR